MKVAAEKFKTMMEAKKVTAKKVLELGPLVGKTVKVWKDIEYRLLAPQRRKQ